MSSFQASAFLVCFFLAAISQVQAKDPCACTPSTYEFTFDFSLTCPRPGGEYPPGISEVTCFITSFSADVEDLTPVSVEAISIIEADLERVPIAQSAIEGAFSSGDSFTYTSVSALGDINQIPQSIQLTITGTNAANSSLVQVWAIKFTNDCDVYPVLETGETFGWTEFTSLGTPQAEVCGAVESFPVPTFAPTFGDMIPTEDSEDSTDEPTVPRPAPTSKGKKTPAPTYLGTAASPGTGDSTETLLTGEPTTRPTVAPTSEPTAEPTTEEPTVAPTREPTIAPTYRPTTQAATPKPTSKKGGKNPKTDEPTIQPTMESSSYAPTKRPTTKVPTTAPQPPVTDDLLEEPTIDMSFSYYMDLEEEDYELDMEWGRGSKKKKDKMDDDKDDQDIRGRVRVGGRRRYYY